MLFNSLEYFVFFAVVLTGVLALRKYVAARVVLLLIASYVFYASNNGWLILLILVSTCIDYAAGRVIAGSENSAIRKQALAVSVVANLSILGYFKYADFFRQTVADIAGTWGLHLGWVDLNVALPVGISFYTFQSMSYTIDVYRRVIPVERSWLRFALYVSYFPQLIAGPIMRASYFLPQVTRVRKLTTVDVEWGVFLICRGLFKKIVLADFLAVYADRAFTLDPTTSALDLWIGLYAFTFQIYFDFSGYTDIAIGSSRLMGYRIPENFRRPYAALGFSDFWQRWHISLSSWLRDYLYISLGGNRHGTWRTYRNLMLTMLLGGLWHGAGWQFVLWGFLHGAYLVGERLLGLNKVETSGGTLALSVRRLIVFHCIALTWIPFRCADLDDVWTYLGGMFAFSDSEALTRGGVLALCVCAGALVFQWASDERRPARRWLTGAVPVKLAAYGAIAVAVVVANAKGAQPFIYFQF